LIHGTPDRRTSTRYAERRLKDGPVHQERCAALQAPHPPYDGLRMPIWRSAARTHVHKCLRIAMNASWYVSNRRIHEDLDITNFADSIKALTESCDSKLADAGKISSATLKALDPSKGRLK
jgi:hypothetical protein